MFGYTAACRDPALALPAAIHFANKPFVPFHRLAPFPLVRDRSRSLTGVDTESSGVVQKTLYPLFIPFLPRSPRPSLVLRISRTSASRVLDARHKSPEQNARAAHHYVNVFTYHFYECPGGEVGGRCHCFFANRCC